MKLILDYSKWICGVNSPYQLGKESTRLLNEDKYMCCLGQFSLQLDKSLNKKELFDKGTPSQLEKVIPLLTFRSSTGQILDSALGINAMRINDDISTTPLEKIELIKKLFSEKSYEIEVINSPTP